jgi:hypothetical protein
MSDNLMNAKSSELLDFRLRTTRSTQLYLCRSQSELISRVAVVGLRLINYRERANGK